jgi:hypothetical protein
LIVICRGAAPADGGQMVADVVSTNGAPGLATGWHGEPSHTLTSKTMACVRRGLCALHGHNLLLHFEAGRVMLQCDTCGWESPGWTCGDTASGRRVR